MSTATEPPPPPEPPPPFKQAKETMKGRKKHRRRPRQHWKKQRNACSPPTNSSRRRCTESIFSNIDDPLHDVHHGVANAEDRPMTVFRAIARDISLTQAGELTEHYMKQLEEQDHLSWFENNLQTSVGMWRKLSGKKQSMYKCSQNLAEFLTHQHLMELFGLQDRRFVDPREQQKDFDNDLTDTENANRQAVERPMEVFRVMAKEFGLSQASSATEVYFQRQLISENAAANIMRTLLERKQKKFGCSSNLGIYLVHCHLLRAERELHNTSLQERWRKNDEKISPSASTHPTPTIEAKPTSIPTTTKTPKTSLVSTSSNPTTEVDNKTAESSPTTKLHTDAILRTPKNFLVTTTHSVTLLDFGGSPFDLTDHLTNVSSFAFPTTMRGSNKRLYHSKERHIPVPIELLSRRPAVRFKFSMLQHQLSVERCCRRPTVRFKFSMHQSQLFYERYCRRPAVRYRCRSESLMSVFV